MAETTRNTTAPRKSTSTARRQAAATQRSTAAKRGAGTRANARTASQARRTTQRAQDAAKGPVQYVQQLAERAMNLQVGAAMEARDRVMDTINTVSESYGSRSAAERQLRKLERRGERELRKGRDRLERELRERRTRVEGLLKRTTRDLDRQRRNVAANVDLVAAQVENAVQTGVTAGAKLVADVSERVTPA